MQLIGPHYIGDSISISSLRNWVLELELTESDTLLLHPYNFENITLEHRDTYGTALPEPYYILGVLIDETINIAVPKDRVIILQDDNRPERQEKTGITAPIDDYRTIFRCGWCGNIVDEDGNVLNHSERNQQITWLQQRGIDSNVRPVNGKCCPNGHR